MNEKLPKENVFLASFAMTQWQDSVRLDKATQDAIIEEIEDDTISFG